MSTYQASPKKLEGQKALQFPAVKDVRELFSPYVLAPSGTPVILHIKTSVVWDSAMGGRLHKARKMSCPRVDWKSPDWRHRFGSYRAPCTCMSQKELAEKLLVSQSVISRIETGIHTKDSLGEVLFAGLVGAFGLDVTFWILTGLEFTKMNKNGELIASN